MSLELKHDYLRAMKYAKPIVIPEKKIQPPPGTLGAVKIIPRNIIPPLNTDIRYSILPKYNIKKYPGLAAIDVSKLPENFNWAVITDQDNLSIKNKKKLITKPPNQMLCGSCWAISSAGVVSDNFVVSGVVDSNPKISTTYSLACYSQNMCQGGNPALLLRNIHQNGIASNHCVDYSWCSESEYCNNDPKKHFTASSMNLSELIPECGCIADTEHFLYKLDSDPEYIALDNYDDFNTYVNTVKRHIYNKGPVSGGYIVFRNFMDGRFTHINGGVYFENGIYDSQQIEFNDEQSGVDNFMGCHAISIIGWGVEKNIIVDNQGTRKDVPYWYCRNSWGTNWGDNGHFKMAMYPYNKISQFDKLVDITLPSGQVAENGGIIMVNASSPPVLQKFDKIAKIDFPLAKDIDYYKSDVTKQKINNKDDKDDKGSIKVSNKLNWKILTIIIILILVILFLILRK